MKKIFALLIVVIICFYVGGCSTKPDTGATGKDSLENTLVYAGEAESTINPLLNSHEELPELIFSGLMKYDAKGKPVPELAESYTYEPETFTYTFHLRKGVKWHDGKEFTAEDVVYTYTELTKDKTLAASITSNYEDITNVTAPDKYTVVMKLRQYDAAIVDYFTMGILPSHLLKGKDIHTAAFNQAPVGTGRYKFLSWDRAGGMITMERNEAYYGKIPNIKRIVYRTVSDETAKATMLHSHEADLAWLNANYAKQFEGQKAFRSWKFSTADYRGAAMDMASAFWQKNADSIGVLNYALDKNAIVQSVLNGQGHIAYSPIQLNPLGTNSAADIYPYDLTKFAQKMEKLGWVKGSDGIYARHGEKFHFTIQTREYEEERVAIAKLMSSMLKQAGVDMEIVLVTKFNWTAGYNGFLAGFATQFDPDMIYSQFVTGASGNTMHYSNAEVNRLLAEGRHTQNIAARKKIYGKFEEVYARSPGILLVAYMDGNYVGMSGIEGLDTTRVLGHHSVGVMWNIENWQITR